MNKAHRFQELRKDLLDAQKTNYFVYKSDFLTGLYGGKYSGGYAVQLLLLYMAISRISPSL